MAGPNRPTPPSAIDGYRRLERTRRIAAPERVPVATAVVPPRRKRARSARVAGIVRLATFVTVLAVIIATSVGLASADTRAAAKRSAVRTKQSHATHVASSTPANAPTSLVKSSAKSADDATEGIADKADAVEEPTPVAAAAANPAPRAAAGSTKTAELPFTGEPSLDRILLAGASLVLLGMLVQIAGQPLPARRVR